MLLKQFTLKRKVYNRPVENKLLTLVAEILDAISRSIRKFLEDHCTQENSNLFFIVMKEDGAFINGIKVANKIGKNGRITLRYAILEILVEQHFNSHVMNRSSKLYLNGDELILRGVSKNRDVNNKETQIEKPIRVLRKILTEKFGVSENDIIETVRWKGYRLNPAHVKLG
ncbi:hypothetical protein FACS1894122_09250 [Alphaproteobacteria bacterium]|nr:hypothetical protein FACS1894122_09250 [Alphaproteobacteria bacterium]